MAITTNNEGKLTREAVFNMEAMVFMLKHNAELSHAEVKELQRIDDMMFDLPVSDWDNLLPDVNDLWDSVYPESYDAEEYEEYYNHMASNADFDDYEILPYSEDERQRP